MSTEVPKRIHLLGSGRHEEGVAAATITPGMLISRTSAGKVTPHAVSGGAAERNYALEDALQGKTITHDYAADDLVAFVSASPGDVIYALLADGENAANGAKLTSNADGTLQVAAGSEIVVAIALEAVDNSETADTTSARIRVRVL